MKDLEWYESTQGPQISLTLISISGLLLPVLKQLFGFEFPIELVDNIINAVMIAGFGIFALYGYIRAKITTNEMIGSLQGEIERLGGGEQK